MPAKYKQDIAGLPCGVSAEHSGCECAHTATVKTGEEIRFGSIVAFDLADSTNSVDVARLPIAGDAATGLVFGVARRQEGGEYDETDTIKENCVFEVLHDGRYTVETIDSAVNRGDVFVNVTPGPDQGKVSSAAGEIIPGAKFIGERATPGVATIYIPKFG